MMRAKLHHAQQIGNKCVALKPAIALAALTSLMPSDEYLSFFGRTPVKSSHWAVW